MLSEESFILRHKGRVVQGDPREYLVKVANEKLLEYWERLERQGEWIKRHPKQIMRQAKRVWKWSVEAGDGRAWIYFIFAVCQWLPTNHRIFYKDKSGFLLDKCQFCVSGAKEDMTHFWNCAAFAQDRENLRSVMIQTLIKWNLPFAEKTIQTREFRVCR